MGVQVGRGAWVGGGAGVVVVLGGAVVDVGCGVGLLDEERLVELLELVDELVLLEELEEPEELDDDSVELSWTGRSSTGGGSDGEAATRNPRKTSRGTHSITARRRLSRPMRRRLMRSSLGPTLT
ncbi:MAG: hypothetical protein ACTMHL_08980 [Janibacter sp.]